MSPFEYCRQFDPNTFKFTLSTRFLHKQFIRKQTKKKKKKSRFGCVVKYGRTLCEYVTANIFFERIACMS